MTDSFKPVRIRKYYIDEVAKGVQQSIWESFFKPLFDILKDNSINNSLSVVVEALRAGRIYYEDGKFKAVKNFSNEVSLELEKLGAKFKYNAYYINRALLPVEIDNTIAFLAARDRASLAALDAMLATLAGNLAKDTLTQLFIEKTVEKMFASLQYDLQKSTDEEVIPVIDVSKAAQNKKVAQDYTDNMNYWVKNWKAKEIVKMRRTILDMTQKSARRETISKYLQKRWKIAKNKADFLARNESGIASSVIKATHYQELGCNHFKWLKSISKEKRELHLEYAKETNNQYGIGSTNIFAFDNPPIIEQIEIKGENGQKSYLPKPNGQKGLPQQTYNCECDFVGVKDIDYYINQEKKRNAERNVIKKITNAIGKCFQRNNPTWRYRRFGEGEAF